MLGNLTCDSTGDFSGAVIWILLVVIVIMAILGFAVIIGRDKQ